MSKRSIFKELAKRRVFQAAAIYFAVAWGAVEIIVTVTEQLELPRWVSTLAVIAFVIGFPVTMFLAWTFDLTSEGLQRTTIGSRRGKASVVGSVLLLVAGTAGLFLLIVPATHDGGSRAGREILPNSIVVMPFRYAGADTRHEYLAAGLADELRGILSRTGDIRVAARSSAVAAQQKQLDAVTIADTLGVAMLLEGSIARDGDRLEVSVELVDGRTGLAIWSQPYDVGSHELPSLQNRIAEEVARRLLPDGAKIVARPATENPSANEFMHRARYFEQQVRAREIVDQDLMRKAADLYRRATEADPRSALAFSRLGAALLNLGDIKAAEAPINRALTLNPDLSEVQNTVGLLYWARGQREAGPAFEHALQLDPYNVDALVNRHHWLWYRQATGGAPELLERALEVDGISLSLYGALGSYYGSEGLVEETRGLMQRILNLQDKFEDQPAVYRLLSFLAEKLGAVDEAIVWTLRAQELEPEEVDHVGRLAELYAIIGDFDTAQALEPTPGVGLLFRMRRYPELIERARELLLDDTNDIILYYLLAFAYNATGQYDMAKDILEGTGQPGTYLNDLSRIVADTEAFYTYLNALYFGGDVETARKYAAMVVGANKGEGISWWYHMNHSCSLAILGRKQEALGIVKKFNKSPELPRYPDLRDSLCMRLLADEPEYRAVVAFTDERRRALRNRLPATLRENGVQLRIP